MKKPLLLLFLLVSIPVFSQQVEIQGAIKVPMDAEAAGITVYNLNAQKGTVTDDDGEFEIAVSLNDSLAISSVQYQGFIVIIDQGTMDSKTLNIAVREAVNELEEVIVRPYDLTGNVRVDVQKVEVLDRPLKKSSMEIARSPVPANQRPVENIAMDDPYMKNGINFVNIFKAIFNSEKRQTTDITPMPKADIDLQVRNLYKDEFFRKYIDIERGDIDDFIFYAQEKGLSNELLQKGHELDLIEFLIEEGENFKRENEKD